MQALAAQAPAAPPSGALLPAAASAPPPVAPPLVPAPPAGPPAEHDECCVCLEQRRSVVLVPCGHFVLCATCAADLMATPQPACVICRRAVELALPVFS